VSGSGDGFEEAVATYVAWLARQPLADRTKREYERWVRSFAAWASAAPEAVDWGGDPLVDPLARDYAARDFKRWLQIERRLAPSSVNLGLASLDSFFTMLGLGQPLVRREQLAQAAPRALDQAEQRRLLRAVERAGARDRALVGVMLFTALRISEARAPTGASTGDGYSSPQVAVDRCRSHRLSLTASPASCPRVRLNRLRFRFRYQQRGVGAPGDTSGNALSRTVRQGRRP
jgi:hypothetical protein